MAGILLNRMIKRDLGRRKSETGLLFELGGNWIVATITRKVETIAQEVETIEANLTLQLNYIARIRG